MSVYGFRPCHLSVSMHNGHSAWSPNPRHHLHRKRQQAARVSHVGRNHRHPQCPCGRKRVYHWPQSSSSPLDSTSFLSDRMHIAGSPVMGRKDMEYVCHVTTRYMELTYLTIKARWIGSSYRKVVWPSFLSALFSSRLQKGEI